MEDFNDLDDCGEIIIMQDEDGNEKEYLVVDMAEDMGVNYLLVVESKSDDETEAVVEAVILKEIEQEDEVSIYDVVEQDDEFERIALLFKNSNEDYEIEL